MKFNCCNKLQITKFLNIELDVSYMYANNFGPNSCITLSDLSVYSLMVHVTMLSAAYSTASSVWVILNNELESLWKQVVVWFEVSLYLLEGTKGNHKNVSHLWLNRDSNQSCCRHKPEVFMLESTCSWFIRHLWHICCIEFKSIFLYFYFFIFQLCNAAYSLTYWCTFLASFRYSGRT